MARKLPQPISKEDFDKLLDASKKQLEPYWMPRKEEYHPRGKTLLQYQIAMIIGIGSGMRISEIVGLNKTYKYKYKNKEGVEEEKEQVCLIQALTPQQVEANFIRVVGGKGGKDRLVPLPKTISAELAAQAERVAALHKKDLVDGYGEVWLPDSLAKKYPKASKQIGW